MVKIEIWTICHNRPFTLGRLWRLPSPILITGELCLKLELMAWSMISSYILFRMVSPGRLNFNNSSSSDDSGSTLLSVSGIHRHLCRPSLRLYCYYQGHPYLIYRYCGIWKTGPPFLLEKLKCLWILFRQNLDVIYTGKQPYVHKRSNFNAERTGRKMYILTIFMATMH